MCIYVSTVPVQTLDKPCEVVSKYFFFSIAIVVSPWSRDVLEGSREIIDEFIDLEKSMKNKEHKGCLKAHCSWHDHNSIYRLRHSSVTILFPEAHLHSARQPLTPHQPTPLAWAPCCSSSAISSVYTVCSCSSPSLVPDCSLRSCKAFQRVSCLITCYQPSLFFWSLCFNLLLHYLSLADI